MSTISKDYLKSIMEKDNISLEDLLNSITSAANEIEEEQKAATVKNKLSSRFSSTLMAEGNDFLTRIAANPLTIDDFILIKAHFLEQNCPGYISANFDSLDDMMKIMRRSTNFELEAFRNQIKDPDNAVEKLIDKAIDLLFTKPEEAETKKKEPITIDPIDEFLKSHGLR